MGFDLLDTPLRLTWDIPGEEAQLTAAGMRATARTLAEAGVFYVLLDGRPLTNPVLVDVVDLLLDGGCQVQLVCQGTGEEETVLRDLTGRPFKLLLDAGPAVSAQGLDAGHLDGALSRVRQHDSNPTLTLTPLRRNLRFIPVLLAFCQSRKIKRFKLPNANIGASFRGYTPGDLPRWPDLEKFREIWREAAPAPGNLPALEIHDLFLWEIMTPGDQKARSEYGGCQAGNSLGHIDAEGILHPCAAWPEPLGTLHESSLEELWQSTQRFMVRSRVEQLPKGCTDCSDLTACLGGCRGLSALLNREEGQRDLMCHAPRTRTIKNP